MSSKKTKKLSLGAKIAEKFRRAPKKKVKEDRELDNRLRNEILTIGVVGITIFLVMCNFHLCSGVGEGIYSITHGLIGCAAYLLPFAGLAVYLYHSYVDVIAKPKLVLISLIASLSTGILHIIGIDETKPFSLFYFFTEGQRGINGGVLGGLTGGLLQLLLGTTSAILILLILILISIVLLTEKSVLEIMEDSAGQIKKAGTGGKAKAGSLFKTIKSKMPEHIFHPRPMEEESEEEYEEEYDEEYDEYEPAGGRIRFPFASIKQKVLHFFKKEQAVDSGRENDETIENTEETAAKPNNGAEPWTVYGADRKRKPIEMPIDLRKEREIIVEKEEEDSDPFSRVSHPESIRKEDVSRPQTLPEEKTPDIFVYHPGRTPKTEPVVRPAETVSERTVKVYETQITAASKSGSLEELGFSDQEYRKGKKEQNDELSKFILYDGSFSMQPPVRNTEPVMDEMESEEEYGEETFDDEIAAEDENPEEDNLEEDSLEEDSLEEDNLEEELSFDDDVPDTEDELKDNAFPPGAVDVNAHVVLEDDMPLSILEDMNKPVKAKAEEPIWKDPGDRRAGSGAVTFSPKPSETVRPAKTVKAEPYEFPPVRLLTQNRSFNGVLSSHHRETKEKLHDTLLSFGVRVNMGNISVGPTVTRYELEPEPGVKVSRIVGLSDDIKLALAAADIRIEAPIPGKSAVGIEVPNHDNSIVGFRELIESDSFQKHPSKLAVAIGRDISGQINIADLAKMPHLLIAGATGSGKSVCINTLIMSILYKASPEDVKIIMIDPKVVELSVYNGIPHLLVPVVTDARKAANALQWAVEQMNSRYRKFADYNVRNLQGYNEALKHKKEIDPENQEPFLYQMVIIVDELADLMMVSPGEVEEAICRLAQMARAAGIHLVLATQRPSVNVITGLIKANVPSRIAFAVSSGVDSRTIIDMNGAEKLLGKGDMLFYPYGLPKPTRVQGAFISDEEVSRVVEFLQRRSDGPSGQEMMERMITSAGESSGIRTERDEYFEKAGFLIIEKDKATIGLLQRHFKIGFNRAARLMDQLADAGVVGEEEGTKPRKILMSREEFEEFLASAH